MVLGLTLLFNSLSLSVNFGVSELTAMKRIWQNSYDVNSEISVLNIYSSALDQNLLSLCLTESLRFLTLKKPAALS